METINIKFKTLGIPIILILVGMSGCSDFEESFNDFIGIEPDVKDLMTNPKNVTLTFRYENSNWTFNYTVYQGLNDYLAGLDDSISGYYVLTKNFIMRDIDQKHQKELLSPLIDVIQDFADNKDDQARIAVSIVQNIPYDYEEANALLRDTKYPYEVLYNLKGVCGEKSCLLTFMLRELGFGVAIFEFEDDNHRAVGIECPIEYSYRDSGYCFVESTKPVIITFSESNYTNVGKLGSCEVIEICQGYSFGSVSEEYYDAIEYYNLIEKSNRNDGILNHNDYDRWLELKNKYGI